MPQPFLDFLCARLAGIPGFVFVCERGKKAGGEVWLVIRREEDRIAGKRMRGVSGIETTPSPLMWSHVI
jgi:hypothetical protein